MLAILSTHPIQYQVPLWQALAKDGRVPFEVWYLSDHGTRATLDREFNRSFAWDLDTLNGYPSRFLKTNSNSDVSRFSRLRLAEPLGDLMRKKEVNALWVQGWQVAAYWQAIWQAHAAGIPVWLRGESNDLSPVPSWKKPIKQMALRRLFSKITNFLYIGEANRRFYKQLGVRDEQLHPAYYCVDNERFKRQADDLRPHRNEIRREWGIPENSFCILFSGKFIPKKRPMDLVNAVNELKGGNNGKPIHSLFAGSGELGSEIRSACKVVYDAEGIASHSTGPAAKSRTTPASFTGFLNQAEISRAYVAADCLVLPSDHRETWGLVVNEAMASGLPCLVSNACGCAEDLIQPLDKSLCFPLGNTAVLADALAKFKRDRPSGKQFEEKVSAFNFDVSVATTAELYSRYSQ